MTNLLTSSAIGEIEDGILQASEVFSMRLDEMDPPERAQLEDDFKNWLTLSRFLIHKLLTTRREVAEAGIYRVGDEDRREAERMGLDVEAALKIKALRLKRQQQKAALQAH